MKNNFWLIVGALAGVGTLFLLYKKQKKAGGTPDQMAKAREAKAKKNLDIDNVVTIKEEITE